MHHSLNSAMEVPTDLEQYEEKKFWRVGVTYGNSINPEGVWYWDTREAAVDARTQALLHGGKMLTPNVSEITVKEASDYARSVGAFRVEIRNSDYDIVEWWLV